MQTATANLVKDNKEVLKYALQMHGINFGVMQQRNQFVRDHVVDSETKYTVKLIIESEREIEVQ